ncbi:MAG: prolyl oligopeptidase family serine peptidase [Solirubrobacterales bacterium]|nr:prolyl oligopeptidase family serine peptidase [Solirubrobacterales bacterium]
MLVAALLIFVLTAPLARATQGGIGGGNTPPPGPKPQLILFHGGSFLFEDPFFRPSTEPRAIASGFVPHYVTYPLGDMPAAVLAARAAAKTLRAKVGLGRVYAYGASAGGTLAALLSGDGLVSAAVAKAPVSDLVGWEWPLGAYGAGYYEQVGLSLSARYRLSPIRRPQRSPLLIYQGRADRVVPPSMNEAFAAKFPRVYLWSVPGGHTTERARPYLIGKAMHWLERTAAQQARAASHADSLP